MSAPVFDALARARDATAKALASLGSTEPVEATLSKQPGADVSVPVFAPAKKLGQTPADLAARAAPLAQAPEFFQAPAALNGYVNFTYAPALLHAALADALSPNFAREPARTKPDGTPETIVLEYSQPNVGKPFHVGHIRSTLLGDATARLLAARGYRVHRMNYLGDAGKQVALLLLAAREFKDLPPMNDEKDMLAYYVKINALIEARPDLEEKTRALLEQIEAGDSAILAELQRVREKSYAAFQRNYDLLGVSFDEVTGESEFIAASKKIVREALAKGVAFTDEKGGEIVAGLEPDGLSNLVILRSNGTTLYSTRDLALADYKQEKYRPARSVILTASEQNLHFRQVKKVLEKLGRPYAGAYEHIGFGLISLPEGKLSTRAGRVVFLEDVLNEAKAAAKAELEARAGKDGERAAAYSPAELDGIAAAVGVGSLKFAVLRVSPEKNIVFNFQQMVAFDGDTGAYLQYALVRAKNILKKAAENGLPVPKTAVVVNLNPSERALAKAVAEFPLSVEQAARQLRPHVVCEALLRFASAFSSFYANTPVLQEPDAQLRGQRLSLVKASERVLQTGLELLGVPALEKM